MTTSRLQVSALFFDDEYSHVYSKLVSSVNFTLTVFHPSHHPILRFFFHQERFYFFKFAVSLVGYGIFTDFFQKLSSLLDLPALCLSHAYSRDVLLLTCFRIASGSAASSDEYFLSSKDFYDT